MRSLKKNRGLLGERILIAGLLIGLAAATLTTIVAALIDT